MSKRTKVEDWEVGATSDPPPLAVKETKSERFQRLAPRRVTKALKAISQVANLGNRATYEYSEQHAQRVIDALYAAVGEAKRRFQGSSVPDNGFTL